MFNTTKYQAYTLLSFDGRFAVYSNLSMGQDDSVLATMGILDLKQTWKDKHVFFGASAVYRDGKSTYNLTPSRFTRDQAIYVRFKNFRWPSV
jgi:hypothetical protein